MRRRSPFVSIFFLVPFLFAQQSPRAVKSSTLSGVVLDSTNSTPVKRATVRLVTLGTTTFEDDQHISAMTDEQGRFEFKELPPGSYEARVEHTGFVEARHSRLIVRLNPGQTMQDLALRLTPAAVITGHVVNEHGEPLANVSVQAMRYAYSATGRRLQGAGGANTDDQGEYRMFGLPPGRYYVRASFNMNAGEIAGSVAPGSGSNTGPQMRYPASYYPGVDSPAEASLLDLRPADQVSIDFNLVPERGVYIRGHLPADPQGALGTFVMLLDEDGMQGQAAAHNGAFEFPSILPGKYTLIAMQVRLDNQKPVRLTRTIQVGQTDLNNVDLEVSPVLSGAIHGRVRVAGNARLELSQLIVTLQATEARRPEFAFQPDDRGNSFPGLGAVQRDGSFVMTMPDDGPGVYYTEVSARGPGLENFYTKAVSYGDMDITESGLTLPTSAAPLEIVIAADGATVQGRVTDARDQPVDNATVVAIPANPNLQRWAELYQPATTDQNGQFTVRGLRPGEYQVYAWQDIESYAFLDPDFMRTYENRGTALKADPNGRYTIVLHVLDEQPPGPAQ
ncbi:MAG TPA: carboxypeptidase regulatory-like domain-containing protein [Terriglobales bacterium]|nr:carboxypeptidase regulatory-like domain-containing protein [Terriglobales bacterium]